MGVPVSSKLLAATESTGTSSVQTPSIEIPSVLKKAYSDDTNDRFWAVASIGQLLCSGNQESIKLLLKNDAIPKLIDRFSDSSDEVVLEATGAIRNLILMNEQQNKSNNNKLQSTKFPDLYNLTQNLLMAVTKLFEKYSPILKSIVENDSLQINSTQQKKTKSSVIKPRGPPINPNSELSSSTKAEKESLPLVPQFDSKCIFGILENLFVIVQAVLETYPKGAQIVNQLNIVPVLIYCLKTYSNTSYNLASSAGLLLYNMSETNISMAQIVLSNQGTELADSLNYILITIPQAPATKSAKPNKSKQSDDTNNINNQLFLRILAGATLANLIKSSQLSDGDSSKIDESTVNNINRTLLELISQFIDTDYNQELINSIERIKYLNTDSNSKATEPLDCEEMIGEEDEEALDGSSNSENNNSTNKEDIISAEINSVLEKADNVQLVLELAANIFCDEGFDVSTKEKDQEGTNSEDEWMDQDDDNDEEELDGENSDLHESNLDGEMEVDPAFTNNSNGSKGKNAANANEEDFDVMDMNEVLGNEGTLAKSVWSEAEPMINVFINVIIPKLVQLVILPTSNIVIVTRELVGSLEANSNSSFIGGGKCCEPVGIVEKYAVSVLESYVELSSTALACLNNFLTVVEGQYSELLRNENGSNMGGGSKYQLAENIPSWYQMIYQSIGVQYEIVNYIYSSLNGLASSSGCVCSCTNPATSTGQGNIPSCKQDKVNMQLGVASSLCVNMERCVSCLWTVCRVNPLFSGVNEDMVNSFLSVFNMVNCPVSLKTAIVGLVGKLGQIRPGFIQVNLAVGQFLINHVVLPSLEHSQQQQHIGSSKNSVDSLGKLLNIANSIVSGGVKQVHYLMPSLQALDDIFDIYGDKSYDYDEPVFKSHNLLSVLETGVLPKLKLAVKGIDKRKNKSLRVQGDLTVVNLAEFIKYKKSEI
ncbi:putative ARM-like repeat-containing protein [Smittium culicis]|uniref:Putative ARM-like repeat-containing protein n=1 Tax=Smittium culicis TaxID=133412 RepID=A0A1R1YN86_9FUNG|nr:putative ARM-like repeat-containing protein [Smittium culicis]OMJ28379.1 putative ARM-like repeat-containing protein [Smittium culicis]